MKIINCLLLIVACLNILFIEDYSRSACIYLGALIVIVSVLMLVSNQKDKVYIILFGIITYVNISMLLSDCLYGGGISLPINTLSWQVYRGSIYEIRFLEALFLMLSCMNLILSYTSKDVVKETDINRKSNIIIFLLCFCILIYGLFSGYVNTSTLGGYESHTSTLYEYCVLFLLFAWYYSGSRKICHVMIWCYAIIYIIQAIMYGDRSSAFPMLLLMLLLYFKKITVGKLFLFAIAGIVASNSVAVYRDGYSLSGFLENYITRYALSGFTSDTVSQSYYTGVSFFYVHDIVEAHAKYFLDFLLGIVFGGDYGYADVAALCKLYATNKGGGFMVSDFYFWWGYLGAAVNGVIVAFILCKLKKITSGLGQLWKVYIAVMVFRWYLYTAFDFYRGCIFVFLIVGVCFSILDFFTKKSNVFYELGRKTSSK